MEPRGCSTNRCGEANVEQIARAGHRSSTGDGRTPGTEEAHCRRGEGTLLADGQNRSTHPRLIRDEGSDEESTWPCVMTMQCHVSHDRQCTPWSRQGRDRSRRGRGRLLMALIINYLSIHAAVAAGAEWDAIEHALMFFHVIK